MSRKKTAPKIFMLNETHTTHAPKRRRKAAVPAEPDTFFETVDSMAPAAKPARKSARKSARKPAAKPTARRQPKALKAPPRKAKTKRTLKAVAPASPPRPAATKSLDAFRDGYHVALRDLAKHLGLPAPDRSCAVVDFIYAHHVTVATAQPDIAAPLCGAPGCGLPMTKTVSGMVCPNGHGGAEVTPVAQEPVTPPSPAEAEAAETPPAADEPAVEEPVAEEPVVEDEVFDEGAAANVVPQDDEFDDQ